MATSNSPTCGRVKIPHLRWRSYPLSDRAKWVYRFWIERSILFSFFHPERFRFRWIDRTDVSLSWWLLPSNSSRWADSPIALIQTRSYVNLSGGIPGESDFMSVGARLWEQIGPIVDSFLATSFCFDMSRGVKRKLTTPPARTCRIQRPSVWLWPHLHFSKTHLR